MRSSGIRAKCFRSAYSQLARQALCEGTVGGVPGLYLRIEGNCRSWVFRHQSKGKRQEFGLGSYPEVSLAQARDRAWERRLYRNALLVNPPQARVVPQPPQLVMRPELTPPAPVESAEGEGCVTFKSCARTYIAAQQAGWKSFKHAKQWASSLNEYAHPVIGNCIRAKSPWSMSCASSSQSGGPRPRSGATCSSVGPMLETRPI